MQFAASFPHPSLEEAWAAGLYAGGCTEPWTVDVLGALLRASGARRVLETGSYIGTTTAWLALDLERTGGGEIIVIEIDPARRAATSERLASLSIRRVALSILGIDALAGIDALPPGWCQFAFVDDDHTASHVIHELDALLPKMASPGLVALHDVVGPFGLDQVVRARGGTVLTFPRLHVAGGLGLIST